MKEVQVPKMGMSTVEVDLVHWHVQPGARVNPGDPLADIESEKSTITIVAECAGTVTEQLVAAGASTTVGAVICKIRPD